MDRGRLQEYLRVYFPVGSAILSSILSFLALLTLGTQSVVLLMVFSLIGTLLLMSVVFWYVQRKSYSADIEDIFLLKAKYSYDLLDADGEVTVCKRELTLCARKPSPIYLTAKPTSTGKQVNLIAYKGSNREHKCTVNSIVSAGKPTLLIAFDTPLKGTDDVVIEYEIHNGFVEEHESVLATSDIGQEACEIRVTFPPGYKPSESRWTVSYYNTVLEYGETLTTFNQGAHTIFYDFSKHIQGSLIKKECAIAWRRF
jgi:hypothetical protein